MAPLTTRKPRAKPEKPYNRKPREKKVKDVAKTSAKRLDKANHKDNLTLHDWLTVVRFADEHKDLPQHAIVEHFRSKKDGALFFSQSALSWKLQMRSELESRANANPMALSSKRPQVVTRPDVEEALVEWVRHMEARHGESLTGPMLKAKRKIYEQLFQVPEDERLTGDGWIGSFCKTYNIKERRRHGESGSVDKGDAGII